MDFRDNLDEELGMGMLSNNGRRANDLDNMSMSSGSSKSSSASANMGQNMRRGGDLDSNGSVDEQSVSSYAGSDLSPEEENNKKRLLLFKLKRMAKKGYRISRAYNMNDSLEDIQAEVESIKREANLDQGTKVAKNALISICSLLEYGNNKFDPFDIVLDGWSEEINEDVENGEYDEVMEEIYYKYYDKITMAPEVKLMMMVGGSAFKFHLSHTLLKQMVPGADTLLKQNPNLKNEIMNLVNKTPEVQNAQQEISNMHNGSVKKTYIYKS
jgi:hypothetical protein